MSTGEYSFPKGLILRATFAVLAGGRRSLEKDALTAISAIHPAPKIVGADLVPKSGSFVLVGNHFQRKGLWIGWGALLVTCAISKQRPDLVGSFHWLTTSEWPLARIKGRTISNPLYRLIFKRVSRMYGFMLLSADDEKRAGRAIAMRRAALALQKESSGGNPTAVGIFPEGKVGNGLIRPPAGAGSFIAFLNRSGIPIVPVGIAEENNVLVAHFGEPFHIELGKEKGKPVEDQRAIEEVMVRIGELIPEDFWGVYRSAILSHRTVKP